MTFFKRYKNVKKSQEPIPDVFCCVNVALFEYLNIFRGRSIWLDRGKKRLIETETPCTSVWKYSSLIKALVAVLEE